MPRLMLVALLALSGCALRYVNGNGARDVPMTQTGVGVRQGAVITIDIDGSGDGLCSPDDADPQHTCPAQSGPDQR